jgi:hypothetical protein
VAVAIGYTEWAVYQRYFFLLLTQDERDADGVIERNRAAYAGVLLLLAVIIRRTLGATPERFNIHAFQISRSDI